jgi:hypothetical protein
MINSRSLISESDIDNINSGKSINLSELILIASNFHGTIFSNGKTGFSPE